MRNKQDNSSAEKSNANSYIELVWFSLPSIVALALEPLANIIDTAFLGQLNSTWVAAMAITHTVVLSLGWMFNFLIHTVTAQVGRYVGEGDGEKVFTQVRLALLIALVLGLIVTVLLLLVKEAVFIKVMGADQELLATGSQYWNLRVIAVPFVLVSYALSGVLRGLLKVNAAFVMAAMITGTNVFVTYVLLFHFDMGMLGAGLGTFVSYVFGSLFGLIAVYVSPWCFKKNFFAELNLRGLSVFGKASLNLFLRTSTLTSAFFLMTTFASHLGVIALAAHQIGLQVWLFVSYFTDGLAVTATAKGAYFLGEKKYKSFRLLGYRILKMSFLVGVLFALGYLLVKPGIQGMFTSDEMIVSELNAIWLLLALSQPLFAVLYVYDGILFGSHDFSYLRKRMIEGFVVIFLPLLVLSYFQKWGLIGMWMALCGLNLYRMATGAKRFHFYLAKLK